MRIFLVLICSLALASLAPGAEQGKGKKKEEPKKQAAHAGQVSQPAGKGAGKSTTAGHSSGAGKPSGVSKAKITGKTTGAGKPTTVGGPGAGKPSRVGKEKIAGKPAPAGGVAGSARKTKAGVPAAQVKAKPFKPQRFNLASKSKPNTSVAPAVSFQQNRRIQGSQNWHGSNYTVFRNYTPVWHDSFWWRNHYNRIVFVFGGWYFWNSGYWYPAWGYDPYAYYFYDGPIYGYNDLPPDQVIANVQASLQEQGYYQGEVDGVLGPLTRAAIANYQRDQGLYITSAIDEPTLASLGMA